MKFRGGGATRNKAPASDLTLYVSGAAVLTKNPKACLESSDDNFLRHSVPAAKSVETKSKRDFKPLPRALESANSCKNNLRPASLCDKLMCKAAFTMAEVLITLGIIGIVAAMTLPALIGKYQKLVTVNKLKKVYTVLSQLVIKAQEDNGPAYFSTSEEIDPDVMKKFFNTYWKPYFHSPTVLSEGVFPFNPSNDKKYPIYMYINNMYQDIAIYTIYRAGRVFFITNDGTAYCLLMVRWTPIYDDEGNIVKDIYRYSASQTVYADINGVKPPNIIGKDVFMFIVDFDKSIVRANGYDKTTDEINTNCSHSGTGAYCAAKIMQDGWEIADEYPW